MLYLSERQASGDYIVRVGWRAIGYRFSAEEYGQFESLHRRYQWGFCCVIAAAVVFGFDHFPELLLEGTGGKYVAVVCFCAVLGALFRLYINLRDWSWTEGKVPCDAGLPYWERRGRTIDYSLANHPYAYLVFPAFALIMLVIERESVAAVLGSIGAVYIVELLLIKLVWRKRVSKGVRHEKP